MRRTEVELPTVLIFATGGTIGMHDLGKGLEIDPNFGEILEHRANEIALRLGYRARVNQLQPAIESANADEETAPKIARAIRARVGAMRASAVVVTHGTDTLAYTASRLAFELADLGVPVTITGSQFPHGAEQTDAFDNLSLAIRTVTQANPKAPVSVAFGGTVIPAVRATKSDAEGLIAFRAERKLGGAPRGLPQRSVDGGSSIARVVTFRFTPGVNAADLLAAVGGGPDALVLECYGAGNAPMAQRGIADALAEVSARMPVVAVTQCALGSVDTERYAVGRQFAATGVIGGSDLTLEAAIAKVGYLIDQGFTRPEIAELMPHNLVGELTPSAA
ncbi:asparaginase domain-containing protein [Leucobacter denitrificans]|uniref:asparaginase n=1 Tax=Leucobacter denitrificans TaxID=683042 RepID=A0A7G9S6K8_9MICO|nr:asparaginase domain-containing protein [Leucobacter denitrificans]QNN63483.1 asparaginase [Leucobacter denitrificans]